MNRHLIAIAITGGALVTPSLGHAEPLQPTKSNADWFENDAARGGRAGEAVPSAAQTKQEQPPVSGGDWFDNDSAAPVQFDDGASLSPAPLTVPQARLQPPVGDPRRTESRSNGGLVPVRFESDDPSVRLLAKEGEIPYEQVFAVGYGWYSPYHIHRSYGVTPVYLPICEGPCAARVPRGAHQLAVTKPGSSMIPVGTWSITKPSLIRAQYIDRSNLRTAGAVVGVVGVLTGMVLMVASVHNETDCGAYSCTTRAEVHGGLVAGGLGVFAGSIVASVILLNQRDRAVLSVAPMVAASGVRTDGTLRLPVSRLGEPQGIAASVRF